jgi:glycyl-tRNA synthetase beta chain
MDRKDFLLEIGCEELPPGSLRTLAAALCERMLAGLAAADADGALRKGVRDYWYCSPRRLALVLQDVPVGTAATTQERLGPAVQAAFDKDGKPTKAAEGFAASVGTTVDKLEHRATDKGERLAFTVEVPGKQTVELLPGIVEDAMKQLPIPKRMRWGDGDAEFIRPVHWIVMLFGNDVVETELLGVKTGRTSYGHRFHAPGPIELKTPSEYANALEAAHVRVNDSSNSLAEWIGEQVVAAADALNGKAIGAEPGSDLLDDVAALNEWPVPVVGTIPERFLVLPEEVLITTLQVHQRYFPVRGLADGKDGALKPNFITFANIESKDPDRIREGNERVVVPRLEDAMFFWNTDRKRPLADRVAELDNVTFQKQLGSLGDKVRRVTSLAKTIAGLIDGDVAKAERAATLAKADLVTDMVFEFTELQGVIGKYYAEADGEDAEVAAAIFEQYLPRFAGDELPATKTGQALAIADKLDTIVGIYAINQPPSGSKDPFALRRQGLGLMRIIIEKQLDLDLIDLIGMARKPFDNIWKLDDSISVFGFLMERLKAYYVDQQIDLGVYYAVEAIQGHSPLDFDRRVKAVQNFLLSDEAKSLAAANKRISNILRKAEESVEGNPDPSLFRDDAEKAMGNAVADKTREIEPLAAAGDYSAMLASLAELREPVDRFFDDVMVMADDDAVRLNRLRLLNQLRGLFNHTADFAQIQVD